MDEIKQTIDALVAKSHDHDRLIAEITADERRHQGLLNDPRADRILALERWLEQVELTAEPLITVVLPTFNRPDAVIRAARSVAAQTYGNWELVVVDDGSARDPSAGLSALQEPRLRVIRQANGGVSKACNAALAAALGEIVAYLEDDNTMSANWLRAVAWAFETRPDVELLYGAMIWERDELVVGAELASGMPILEFQPFSRDLLRLQNWINIGAVAHRANLPEAGFDESLQGAQDYDFIIRATQGRSPLPLPAIAGYYRTSGGDRMSDRIAVSRSIEEVRRKHGFDH